MPTIAGREPKSPGGQAISVTTRSGVRGGAIHGSSDRLGAYPATDPVRPDDIAATMFWALGLDPATEVFDPLGRPLPIADGKPITGIFF